MWIKQGMTSQDPASLFTFWGHNVRWITTYDAYGDVKKNKYDLEKAKKERGPNRDPTKLEIYTELEWLYADLWPMDVRDTVDHDAWKAKIDVDTHRNAYDFEAKAKEMAVEDMKAWIANAFKKHKEAHYKTFINDINEQF